jgi:hypothetical protein
MRILALALAISLAGCSFLTAPINNDPRVGCSRIPATADTVLALVGVAGMVTATVLYAGTPEEEAHTDYGAVYRGVMGLAVLYTLLTGTQAAYGFHVAGQCRAERARLGVTR